MQTKRSWRDYLALATKGMVMGAADAVPGVSGGTIAFITGIYEELIFSLKQCGPQAISVLFRQGMGAMWQYINGTFLVTLLLGILCSLLTVSRIVLYWLDTYPVLLWSFFFGLILAAIWSLIRHIEQWKANVIAFFILGTLAAYFITTITPSNIEPTGLFVFLSGMLAICAMILPGISGSFILLLLGMYTPILTALKNFEMAILGLFAMGCVVGLLSFSRVLNWMFSTQRTITLALLGGFMLGSLNKVWPWKNTLESTINSHGKAIPLVQENILPGTFEVLTSQPSYLWYSLALTIIGAGVVLLLEKVGSTSQE
ncbi:MAG: putative membrane protein [Paraglaciecola sp.]|jgi:putative membrane protein